MATKKHASTRARRNVASGAATLPAEGREGPVPPLPEGIDWHPAVVEMWDDLWASPMASEYHDSDLHQLLILARLHQDFYEAETTTGRREAAVEIRLQRKAFGLDPFARRSLEWQIETAEGAKERGQQRRRSSIATPPAAVDDPRVGLRAV
jgi:hypothetical protein